MKLPVFSRSAISCCAAAAVLAGCTSAQQAAQAVPSAPSASNKAAAGRAYSKLRHPTQATESIVYSFTGKPDGSGPAYENLVDVSGMLYGTTAGGGANGDGTVFKTTTSGV